MADLRTLREPHVPPPRLDELLQFLVTPGLEKIWLLLDIKVDFHITHPELDIPSLTRFLSLTMTQDAS